MVDGTQTYRYNFDGNKALHIKETREPIPLNANYTEPKPATELTQGNGYGPDTSYIDEIYAGQ
jgi:hypothetical protein